MGLKGMSISKAPRRFFWSWGAKSQASDSVARVESLLAMMRLSRADFSAPQNLLEEARTHLAGKNYRKSLEIAERAGKLAIVIDERYRTARKAMLALKAVIKELEDLGLNATIARTALENVRERVKQGVMENGLLVPNYLEARITAEEATKQARALISTAREASDAVFTSQLAIDALKEIEGPIDPQIMEKEVFSKLDNKLQNSMQMLARGNASESLSIAEQAEERANRLRAEYSGSVTGIKTCEDLLNQLSSKKIIVEQSRQLLETGKNFLYEGKISEAFESVERAQKEAKTLERQYRDAVGAIESAMTALQDFLKTGLVDQNAEKRLKNAQKALAEGRYLRALDLADDCRRSMERISDVHRKLGRSLEELKGNISGLREKGVEFVNEVEEFLNRAEEAYKRKDYGSAGKDMKIASMLMNSVSHTGKTAFSLFEEPEDQIDDAL